jgi:hypothetical protein
MNFLVVDTFYASPHENIQLCETAQSGDQTSNLFVPFLELGKLYL